MRINIEPVLVIDGIMNNLGIDMELCKVYPYTYKGNNKNITVEIISILSPFW